MKFKVLSGIFFITTIALLLVALKLNKAKTVCSSNALELARLYSNCEDRLQVVGNNLLQFYALPSAKLDGSLPCTVNQGEKTTLKGLVGGGKIIYRFSQSDCMDCVYESLPLLDTLGAMVGYENLLVSAEGYKLLEMLSFGEANGINADLLMEPQGFMEKIPVNSPVFFIAGPDLQATCFFNPDKNHPDLAKKYFRIISKHFSK